jgi:hypothetical protein
MTRYVCSKCGYAADTPQRVSKHIDRSHDLPRSAEDRYGNTSPSYEYRPRIMVDENDPGEEASALNELVRDLLTFRR